MNTDSSWEQKLNDILLSIDKYQFLEKSDIIEFVQLYTHAHTQAHTY